ncbi:glycosyltransferase [Sphingomonas sp.]|uniref:glycosyltransferase n=1 Tax=Sphingomonas sp. TaxID=28214 RepID=UPI0035C81639
MTALTIILPTYNGASYLAEQVRSIQAQRFTDWRMLICDDGSSDDTVAVTAALAAGEPRIAVLPGGGNIGQRRRLRELAEAADTDLIAVADQDDVWEHDKLALLMDEMGDADLCFGSSWLIDGDGQPFGRDIAGSLQPAYIPDERLTVLIRPLVSAHAMIARRKLFNAPALARIIPFDWLMSIEAAWGEGLRYVPSARTNHRLHGANQHNGFLLQTPDKPRLVSGSALRMLPHVVGKNRMHLMGMLEHLAFADTLSKERQALAREAWGVCRDYWYTSSLAWRGTDTARTKLEVLLRPMAGSENDWRYFALHLDALCLPFHAPARMAARRARLALEWPA